MKHANHTPIENSVHGTHTNRVKNIIVCQEKFLPLVLTFFKNEKAFNSVQTNAILPVFANQGVGFSYMRTVADCYWSCSSNIQIFHRRLTTPIGKGVRKDDTMSPKLFTAPLQCVMKSPIAAGREGISNVGKFLQILVSWMTSSTFREVSAKLRRCSINSTMQGNNIEAHINMRKTHFMKNPLCEDE